MDATTATRAIWPRGWFWALPSRPRQHTSCVLTLACLLLALPAPGRAQWDAAQPNGEILAFAMQPDGRILIGGNFTALSSARLPYIARLNRDGSLDQSFEASPDATVAAICVQPDGKIVIGGSFTAVSGFARSYIARLNSDGTVDQAFDTALDGEVKNVTTQPDGKLLVGGDFSVAGGVAQTAIARLNKDGSVDTTFSPPDDMESLVTFIPQPDGKIVVSGRIFFPSGTYSLRWCVRRLNADGSLDGSFATVLASTPPRSLAVQADGKIVVGGGFLELGSQAVATDARNFLARLNEDGTIDTSFLGFANYDVLALALQADGGLIVGGRFYVLWSGGDAIYFYNRLGRFDANGSIDHEFPVTSIAAWDSVNAVTILGDGQILAAGVYRVAAPPIFQRLFFRSISTRVSATASFMRAPSFDGTTINWMRDGSLPEVSFVLFQAEDGAGNRVLLGRGARITGGWRLTRVTLPPGTRLIRAQAYYGDGRAGSITEASLDLADVCVTPDPFANLGGGVCHFGDWLPPGIPPPGTPPPLGCTLPDPFTAIGGGTCFNGGWLPPGMYTQSSWSTETGGCLTPDPFAVLGGGTCANGGWLPPGMPVPRKEQPAAGGCATPDPFVILGGGTCVNGGWLPPGMPAPRTEQPVTGGCSTPDPFVILGGGTCVNGGWLPPGMKIR